MNWFRKALLLKTIKMCEEKWIWYFCGFTIRQYGFGIIWRKKIDQALKGQKGE